MVSLTHYAQLSLIDDRKDKPIGSVFDHTYSINEALDAAADTYNGVSKASNYIYGQFCLTF